MKNKVTFQQSVEPFTKFEVSLINPWHLIHIFMLLSTCISLSRAANDITIAVMFWLLFSWLFGRIVLSDFGKVAIWVEEKFSPYDELSPARRFLLGLSLIPAAALLYFAVLGLFEIAELASTRFI